jgi:hypothetical protein
MNEWYRTKVDIVNMIRYGLMFEIPKWVRNKHSATFRGSELGEKARMVHYLATLYGHSGAWLEQEVDEEVSHEEEWI